MTPVMLSDYYFESNILHYRDFFYIQASKHFFSSKVFFYSKKFDISKNGKVVGEKLMGLTVNGQLKELVEQYLIAHPSLTLNAFAKRSGVGMTTLRRIVQEETKSGPAPHTILAITSYVKKEKNLSKILSTMQGPVGEVLKDCFSNYVDEELKYNSSAELNDLLVDRDYYFIYKLAANRNGTNEYDIFSLLGEIGLSKLKELEKTEFITRSSDDQIHSTQKNFSIDLEIAKRHLKDLVSLYKPEELSINKNLLYSQSESVNEEAISEIRKIHREAAKKIHKILEADSSQGDIPYFSINLCETLIPQSVRAGEYQ